MPKKQIPEQYKQGSSYTGVNEEMIGHKPGIVKTVVQLSYGVYKTREVKLSVDYCGYDDASPCDDRLKISLTLPEKWLDHPTPVTELRKAFIKSYRRKFPSARLSQAEDSEWGLAMKDESMLMFSKKKVPDDAIITKIFYDRQEIWVMAEWDWEEHARELKRLRKVIVDDLAKTMRHVLHDPNDIVPVMSKKQIVEGQSYVILTGWYKQQCCIVEPHFTVADIKAYLHHKNGPRMPLEALDVAIRKGDTVEVLDSAWTLQQVFEKAIEDSKEEAKDKEGDEEGDEEDEEDEEGGAGPEEEGDDDSSDWDENEGWHDDEDKTATKAEAKAVSEEGEILLDTDDHAAKDTAAPKKVSKPAKKAPSFQGRAMVLGVGKRIQDRKHSIWLPQVHDPWSFRTPNDEAPAGGTQHQQLTAPKGWTAPSSTQATVNQDENCSIM